MYHSTSNWLGEPVMLRLDSDPDAEYERLLEDLEIENALTAQQLNLSPRRPGFPRSEAQVKRTA